MSKVNLQNMSAVRLLQRAYILSMNSVLVEFSVVLPPYQG